MKWNFLSAMFGSSGADERSDESPTMIMRRELGVPADLQTRPVLFFLDVQGDSVASNPVYLDLAPTVGKAELVRGLVEEKFLRTPEGAQAIAYYFPPLMRDGASVNSEGYDSWAAQSREQREAFAQDIMKSLMRRRFTLLTPLEEPVPPHRQERAARWRKWHGHGRR